MAVLLDIIGGLSSSGGVTSSPILSFRAILIGFWKFVEKCANPISSRLLFLLVLPTFGRPCRNEFDLLSKISSMTLSELDRPLWCVDTVGLSGSDKEFDFVVTRGGGRGAW